MMSPGAAHTDRETMRRRTQLAMPAIVCFGRVETGGSIAGAIVARTREPGPTSGRRTRQPTSSSSTWGSRTSAASRSSARNSGVRNLRAARGSELRLGRQREPIGVEELSDDAKPPILRAYLRRWKMETGQFFDGVTAEEADAYCALPDGMVISQTALIIDTARAKKLATMFIEQESVAQGGLASYGDRKS